MRRGAPQSEMHVVGVCGDGERTSKLVHLFGAKILPHNELKENSREEKGWRTVSKSVQLTH